MNVVACAAPHGSIEPAPLTSFPVDTGDLSAKLAAFWAADDRYYVRADGDAGTRWFRIEAEQAEEHADEAARAAMGRMLADIIPMGGGRVAFPIGSTGRTVFRVWRSRGADQRPSRTRILAVRAARSRRLPA
jgi:hypothetical protein